MTAFVDSNVLIDVLTADANWGAWSRERLTTLRKAGPLFVNGVAYAETSIRVADATKLDSFLDALEIALVEPPREALVRAGRAFLEYRRQGGSRHMILPDFFIGAHALTVGSPLLTRDVRRYRRHFPDLELIEP